jgi:spore maturation protein CgeB
MKCVLFYHAFSSCWNNGNAHFLRGVARELHNLGHDVVVYEPAAGWSRLNALRDGGEDILREVPTLFPGIEIRPYSGSLDLDLALDGANLVIVHEWNEPDLIADIGRRRIYGAPFTLLFHDTHHRAVTAPHELQRFDLDGFDGVLAFGEVLRQIYLRRGWANRAYTWHEAADTTLYRPLPHVEKTHDVIWIGNWGDGERGAELRDRPDKIFLELRLKASVHGVRYSHDALRLLKSAGIEYCGWMPAHRTPAAFAGARATVHVPRAPYAKSLPGIPTIRMFEALACGIPVVSAPWDDCENLLPKKSYLRAESGTQMKDRLSTLLADRQLAADIRRTGLEAITTRHTCRHRALELLGIAEGIRGAPTAAARADQAEEPA